MESIIYPLYTQWDTFLRGFIRKRIAAQVSDSNLQWSIEQDYEYHWIGETFQPSYGIYSWDKLWDTDIPLLGGKEGYIWHFDVGITPLSRSSDWLLIYSIYIILLGLSYFIYRLRKGTSPLPDDFLYEKSLRKQSIQRVRRGESLWSSYIEAIAFVWSLLQSGFYIVLIGCILSKSYTLTHLPKPQNLYQRTKWPEITSIGSFFCDMSKKNMIDGDLGIVAVYFYLALLITPMLNGFIHLYIFPITSKTSTLIKTSLLEILIGLFYIQFCVLYSSYWVITLLPMISLIQALRYIWLSLKYLRIDISYYSTLRSRLLTFLWLCSTLIPVYYWYISIWKARSGGSRSFQVEEVVEAAIEKEEGIGGMFDIRRRCPGDPRITLFFFLLITFIIPLIFYFDFKTKKQEEDQNKNKKKSNTNQSEKSKMD